MKYRLVEEEKRTADRRRTTWARVAGYAAVVVAIAVSVAGTWLLTSIESRLDEPGAKSTSVTGTIIVSVVLIILGAVIGVAGVVLLRRYSSWARFLGGGGMLWQKPFVESGELPFAGDARAPLDTPEQLGQARPPDTSTGPVEGVALCPRCRNVVRIKAGICTECGSPVV